MPSADGVADHVAAELHWLELVLQRRALDAMSERDTAEKFDQFAGSYVSGQEIARYAVGMASAAPRPSAQGRDLDARIEASRRELDQRAAAALAGGRESRLQRLRRRFELSEAELRILVTCLAPDWELRFQRYFAYLQNDVARRRPTIQLLGELHLVDQGRAAACRATFAPDRPLVGERLVMVEGRDEAPFPDRQPRLAEVVADYLAGHDRLDAALGGSAALECPAREVPAGPYYAQHRRIVRALCARLDGGSGLPTAYIGGPRGCGKRLVPDVLAAAAGSLVLRVDCRALAAVPCGPREALRLVRRDARLHGCLVVLAGCEALLQDAAGLCGSLEGFLVENPSAGILLTGEAPAAELSHALSASLWTFELARPGVEDRAALWRDASRGSGRPMPPELVDHLAAAFRFTPLEVAQVLEAAGPEEEEPDGAEPAAVLLRRCRARSRHAIYRFARRVVPTRGWDDLVLPADARAQLEEICQALRGRRRVYQEWGFERKLALGKGLTVLFAGPSGVGKTMSAEIIAGELGLDLFAVDLSCVVSKYIGETEKNLSSVFDEADATNGVLFFDECDALCGKRTEVKDAHDRYANIEVSYLLQRMDQYEGVLILATNLRSNLDPAFTRRLRHVVEFPFPEDEYRLRIWRGVFPEELPLAEDVDLEFLARQFKLAGGSIMNIALNASSLAAGNGGCVGMKHLILATRRELQKSGKTCSKSDFGRYYSWVLQESGE